VIAAPMPRDAPVTSATRPLKSCPVAIETSPDVKSGCNHITAEEPESKR
jgi:hypothetical protein